VGYTAIRSLNGMGTACMVAVWVKQREWRARSSADQGRWQSVENEWVAAGGRLVQAFPRLTIEKEKHPSGAKAPLFWRGLRHD
jgi:hypothetical protein